MLISPRSADYSTRRGALRHLGIESGNKADAAEEIKLLGRNGQVPWLVGNIARCVPYLTASGPAVMCPAHCLLHGLVEDLFEYALTAKKEEVPKPECWEENSVVFNHEQRKQVEVRSLARALPHAALQLRTVSWLTNMQSLYDDMLRIMYSSSWQCSMRAD